MLQSSRRRLRPIVMTALATMAGMLPLAFALGAGSQMLQPLAIAVIGGILISMVLSLIITPTVHFYLSRKSTLDSELSPVPQRLRSRITANTSLCIFLHCTRTPAERLSHSRLVRVRRVAPNLVKVEGFRFYSTSSQVF